MSDAVLAAIIAATATLCASFLQLRTALARDADARARGQVISRRRSRLPLILVGIMLIAAAVGGFALSQWLGSTQRTAQADLQRELRDRVAELGAAVTALQQLARHPTDAPTAADTATATTTVPATPAAADSGAPPPSTPPAGDARVATAAAPADAPILAQAPTP